MSQFEIFHQVHFNIIFKEILPHLIPLIFLTFYFYSLMFQGSSLQAKESAPGWLTQERSLLKWYWFGQRIPGKFGDSGSEHGQKQGIMCRSYNHHQNHAYNQFVKTTLSPLWNVGCHGSLCHSNKQRIPESDVFGNQKLLLLLWLPLPAQILVCSCLFVSLCPYSKSGIEASDWSSPGFIP